LILYSNQCRCDNRYGTQGSAYSNCKNACSGNSAQICGGLNANSVYKTTNMLLFTLRGHTKAVSILAALPNGNLASVSQYEYAIRIWNLNRRSLLFTITCDTHFIFELSALSNGNLASLSRDAIMIWNPNTGSLVSKLIGGYYFANLVALANDNLAFISSNAVKIWNPNNGSINLIGDIFYRATKLAALPNGNLASGSSDGNIKIWNPNNGSLLFTLIGHTNLISQFATLANGNLASSSDEIIKIWNPNNGSLLYTLTGHTHFVGILAPLPNGNLASSSRYIIIIWNLNNGSLLYKLSNPSYKTIWTLAALPNGNLASDSDFDPTITLWNPNNGSLPLTLNGHTSYVFSLATLSNGNLASGSHDNTIKIWKQSPLAYSNIPFSGYSSTAFNFKILNDQAFDLTLYWVDQSHNFVNYANINIGQTYFQQSYSSYTWVLSNILNYKCFVFKLSTTNQFKLSNRIVKVSNMSDIQCDPYDVPLQYSYWKTQNRDHYFAVSPIINNYCYEFDSGKIIFIFTLDRQNSSQTVLFDSSRSSYVLLDSSKAQFSYLGNPYYVFDYGGWVSSKRNNF